METQIQKTKKKIYLLLTVLTLGFAFLSFTFHDNELEDRTKPQVERAILQVSKLLPRLEEDEQALWEVHDNLEENRQQFYQNNEKALARHQSSDEDVQTLIDKTLSWMNRVTRLRVGQQGHVIVIRKSDLTILAHPNEKFIGEKLLTVGKMGLDNVSEISEFEKKPALIKFRPYFPESFFNTGINLKVLYEAAHAGIYGMPVSYKDTYILCGSTLGEAFRMIIIRAFFTTLIFFAIIWIFVCFIGFSLDWQKDDENEFRKKLGSYAVMGCLLLFVLVWYYQVVMDKTSDVSTVNEYADDAALNMDINRKYQSELSGWLDRQYLEQCRLVADLVKEEGRENLTRADLARYAEDLGVEYIYVFDKNGKTVVTNSPYDHFEISSDETDQSYEFRPLLDGKEYVIQKPMKDETSGEERQYIGVSIRDQNDLADGFVQIVIDTSLRNRLLSTIDVQSLLDNLVIGLPDYALALDKDNLKVVATTGLGFVDMTAEELGVETEYLKAEYDGYTTIDGTDYYIGVGKSQDLYLLVLATDEDRISGAFLMALGLTLLGIGAFYLLGSSAKSGYNGVLQLKGMEKAEEADGKKSAAKAAETASDSDDGDKWGIFDGIKDIFKEKEKFDFDSRWKKEKAIPIEEQTPEMRTKTIIYNTLLIFSFALIVFEVTLINTGAASEGLEGFSYILLGKWKKGFNLFAFSYCLFLLCVMHVFQEFLNQVLYRMAKFSSIEDETIYLLIRNALKYAFGIGFLYIGLAKFGVDTRTLWASAGVLSLMVGFGAKDLINDVIASMFIIFEGTYKIGDFITVGSWSGTVEEIGLRYTKIRNYADVKIINNSALRDIVNSNGDVAREVLKIPIPYETDLLEVEKLLERELPLLKDKIPGLVKAPRYQGVNVLGDSGVYLRIVIFATNWKRRKALRALTREIKLLFDREKVSIPYNHIVVSRYEDEANTYTFTPKEETEGKE